ncbi:hypothetical protein [Endozoicomonas sp. 4G]|uniref:hypothetical protein n=1 Tax=Endozoicomonas sp. 4G TaxID=2872754 RepID=UPI002078B3DC|nr:hypothetical protein [Endozoicomonas sp. 4G]
MLMHEPLLASLKLSRDIARIQCQHSATRATQEQLPRRSAILGQAPRAATAAVAELNKMDGEYKQVGSDLPQATFIQQFGDSSGYLKDQHFVVTSHDTD